MNKRSTIAIAALCLTLCGCRSGGLRNVISWMRPGDYKALDNVQNGSEQSDRLVAGTDTASGQRPSLRERVSESMPWNKSIAPDPFLTADTGVSPDDPRLDVRAPEQSPSSLTRTVSASRDVGPLPTIEPEKPAQKTVADSDAEKPYVPDSEADMQAIERMIANLDPPKRRDAGATPLFGEEAGSTGPRDIDSILAAAMERPSDTASKAMKQELDKAAEAQNAFERQLANAVANHDRHAVTGPGADQALERALSPNEFDKLLDLDRLTESDTAAASAGTAGGPLIRPSVKDGVNVASVDQAFPTARGADAPQTQPSSAQPPRAASNSNLADAVDAFDRTLARAETPPQPSTAFDWNVPANSSANAPASDGTAPAAAPSFESDPFAFASSTRQTEPKPPGQVDFSDFRSQQLPLEPAASTQDQPSASPFQFAASSRAVEPDLSAPPVITIPDAVNPPWETTQSATSKPIFDSRDDSLMAPPALPAVPEVAAETDSPEVVVAAEGGVSFRNFLLLAGGMIVVILLFAPSRKRS